MSNYDVAVFGAGLSGLAVTHYLVRNGLNVLLIDPYKKKKSSPGAPAGLVNPATGRKAKKSWESENCYHALKENLKLLSNETGKELFKAGGVLRPAITEELAGYFKRSFEEFDWPENWVSWLDEGETRQLNPDVAPNYGALFLHCGLTVFVNYYLDSYREYLQNKGVEFWGVHAGYQRSESSGHRITGESGERAEVEKVIVAAGANSTDFEEWRPLPVHHVKGQLVVFRTKKDLAWDHAVSALGYILPLGKNRLVTGSTYEHQFDSLQTTDQAYEQILQKFRKMLPDLGASVEKTGQLAGVRVTTPNYLPVIGEHPGIENLFIYTGMGSKGLLFSEYVAKILGEHILNGSNISPDLDVKRML